MPQTRDGSVLKRNEDLGEQQNPCLPFTHGDVFNPGHLETKDKARRNQVNPRCSDSQEGGW